MRLVTVAGPPSCGKASIVAKTCAAETAWLERLESSEREWSLIRSALRLGAPLPPCTTAP